MSKISFKTKYFWYEEEVSGDRTAFDVIADVKAMIDLCEEIEFPAENEGAKHEEPKAEYKFIPPSDKQIAIMDKFGIEYNEFTDKDAASELIRESMAKKR